MKERILVVEDEDKLRRVIELHLTACGFEVDKAANAEQGLRLADRAGLVLTDLRLPGMSGLELLAQIRRQNMQAPVIVMTAFGTVEAAVEAMKSGATDFLMKPFSLDHLSAVVHKALEMRALRDENRQLREELFRRYQYGNIVGRSPAMQEIFATLMRVAQTRATVLLAGESGVGKDLIARAIHHHSPRRDQPFVKINCTAIPENLMESELFGFEKGAFTGAVASKPGKFELADTGTALLDEIGDVPGGIQVKLLRVLQEREFERLGSNKTRHIDVRILAATNRDLDRMCASGSFREDLLYRINVITVTLPPLRDRREDIPILIDFFLDRIARRSGEPKKTLDRETFHLLYQHDWPGNIRELENEVERLSALSGDKIEAGTLSPNILGRGKKQVPSIEGKTLKEIVSRTVEDVEKQVIQVTLIDNNWKKTKTAGILGISRPTLDSKIEKYRLLRDGSIVAGAGADDDEDEDEEDAPAGTPGARKEDGTKEMGAE